jgi:hypothetical protein
MSDPQSIPGLRILAEKLASASPHSTAESRSLHESSRALARGVLALTEEEPMTHVSTVVYELVGELGVRNILPRGMVAEWLSALAPRKTECGELNPETGNACTREAHEGGVHVSDRLPKQSDGS